MTAQPSFWWDEADDIAEIMAETARDEAERRALAGELEEAALRIQDANASYELALKRVRGAPHGETNKRRADLRTANARVLAAEVWYAELQRRSRWD